MSRRVGIVVRLDKRDLWQARERRGKNLSGAAVHHGQAKQLHAARATVLDAAYAEHPERFVRKPPAPPELPTAAWINKPADTKEAAAH